MFNIIHLSSLSQHCHISGFWYKHSSSEMVRENGAGGAVTRCPASEVVQFVAAWKRPGREMGSGRRTSPFPAQPRGSLPAPEHRHEALMELQHKLLVCLLFVFRINQSCLEEALDNISLCVPLQKFQLQLLGAASNVLPGHCL